jgi:hypothetical protein
MAWRTMPTHQLLRQPRAPDIARINPLTHGLLVRRGTLPICGIEEAMVTNPAGPGPRDAAEVLAEEASRAAAAAVARITRKVATEVTLVPGAAAPDVGLRIARQLEHAARAEVRVHIRRAREDGQSWHAIGALLGFGAIAVDEASPTVAEMGYDYAIGPRTVHAWFPAPPVFRWDCPVCEQTITDRGPSSGPCYDESGHQPGCQRLAEEMAEWDAVRHGAP